MSTTMPISAEMTETVNQQKSQSKSQDSIIERLSVALKDIRLGGVTNSGESEKIVAREKLVVPLSNDVTHTAAEATEPDVCQNVSIGLSSTSLDKSQPYPPATSCKAENNAFLLQENDSSIGNAIIRPDGVSYGSSAYSNSIYDHDSVAYSYQDVDAGSNINSVYDEMSGTVDCNLSESEDSSAYAPGGYHPVQIGELYDARYRIEGKLGWGYFSTVWLATDLMAKPPSFVAIKFQRSGQNHTDAVCDEMTLLKKVREEVISRKWMTSKKRYKDSLGKLYNPTRGVVSFINWFTARGPNGKHICVVLEPMGPNILSLIKIYNFKGVPLPLVRKITAHVLIGLDYLHRVCGIIHTDLKPENILVTSPLHNHSPLEVSNPNQQNGYIGNTKSLTFIPYVKNEIKPCRSDPSCLTSFEETSSLQETLMRKPYHHVTQNIMGPLLDPNVKAIDASLYHPSIAQTLGLKTSMSAAKKRILVVQTKQGKVQLKPVNLSAFDNEEAIFKICDLGNACWIDKHFTDEIQTRQYRAPETILQCGYDQSADLWSLACIVFELVTGDYLFDPHGGNSHDRDINHLQLIVELLGPIPRHMIRASAKMKHYEREINSVKRWPLESVLLKKYKVDPLVARDLSLFLHCILKTNPKERFTAEQLIHHEWLLK